MAEQAADSLFIGVPMPQEHINEVALRCEIMGDIEMLDADDINTFYQSEVEKKDGE